MLVFDSLLLLATVCKKCRHAYKYALHHLTFAFIAKHLTSYLAS